MSWVAKYFAFFIVISFCHFRSNLGDVWKTNDPFGYRTLHVLSSNILSLTSRRQGRSFFKPVSPGLLTFLGIFIMRIFFLLHRTSFWAGFFKELFARQDGRVGLML